MGKPTHYIWLIHGKPFEVWQEFEFTKDGVKGTSYIRPIEKVDTGELATHAPPSTSPPPNQNQGDPGQD